MKKKMYFPIFSLSMNVAVYIPTYYYYKIFVETVNALYSN